MLKTAKIQVYFGQIMDVSLGGARINFMCTLGLESNTWLELLCAPDSNQNPCYEEPSGYRVYY